MVRFKSGRAIFMPPDKAANLWLCINGFLPYMNEKQRKFASGVFRIYLNPDKAPKEYLEAQREKDREKQLELVPRPWYADR